MFLNHVFKRYKCFQLAFCLQAWSFLRSQLTISAPLPFFHLLFLSWRDVLSRFPLLSLLSASTATRIFSPFLLCGFLSFFLSSGKFHTQHFYLRLINVRLSFSTSYCQIIPLFFPRITSFNARLFLRLCLSICSHQNIFFSQHKCSYFCVYSKTLYFKYYIFIKNNTNNFICDI